MRRLRLADGLDGEIGCALAQRRRDAADMEPVGPLEDGFPVEGGGACLLTPE